MTTTIEAIYENGALRLARPLPLPEKARVVVTIETEAAPAEDAERTSWLKLSEEKLAKAWEQDDVFNELLKR